MMVAKDIRGGTWEGLFAGLFGGVVVAGQKGVGKSDVNTSEGGWSLKFMNTKNEAPTLAQMKTQLDNVIKDGGISEDETIYKIFNTPDSETDRDLFDAKHDIFDQAFDGVDYVAVAYPSSNENAIVVYWNDTDSLRDIIIDSENPPIVKPKSGPSSVGELRLSARGWKQFPHFEIIFPTVEDDEYGNYLKRDKREDEIMDIFGKYGDKIPPEVLTYMRKNPKTFMSKLKNIPGYEKYLVEEFSETSEYLTQSANDRLKTFKRVIEEKCNLVDEPKTIGFRKLPDYEKSIRDAFSRCWNDPKDGAFVKLANITIDNFDPEEYPLMSMLLDDIYEISLEVGGYITPRGDDIDTFDMSIKHQDNVPEIIYGWIKDIVDSVESMDGEYKPTKEDHGSFMFEIMETLTHIRDVYTSSFGEPEERVVGY